MNDTCIHGAGKDEVCNACVNDYENFTPARIKSFERVVNENGKVEINVEIENDEEMQARIDDEILTRYFKEHAAEYITPCPVGYEELDRVLFEAFGQSAHGKGKARHANDLAFPDQPIMTIGRMVGVGGHSYQIMKKAQEATNMHGRGEHDAAIAEFRGAIIYAAAAILLIEEKRDGSK